MGTWNQCNGVVMEVKLEKSEIWDLLQVGSIELAGNLRCSRGGARMTPRCGEAGLRWGKPGLLSDVVLLRCLLIPQEEMSMSSQPLEFRGVG